VIVPFGNCGPDEAPDGCEVLPVKTVGEALDHLMDW
jgi:hypothetical protein